MLKEIKTALLIIHSEYWNSIFYFKKKQTTNIDAIKILQESLNLLEKSCNNSKELYSIFNSCLTCLLTFLDLEKAEFECESGCKAPKTKIEYNNNFLFRG